MKKNNTNKTGSAYVDYYKEDWNQIRQAYINELLPNINVGVSFWEEFDQKCPYLQP